METNKWGMFFVDGNDPQGGKHDDERERKMVRRGICNGKRNENKYSGGLL